MSVSLPREPIVLVRRVKASGPRDRLGNESWEDGDNIELSGTFAPQGTSESLGNADQVVESPEAFIPMPASGLPAASDQIIARGVRYDIDGAVRYWGPSSAWTLWSADDPDVQVTLKAVQG